MVKYPLMDSDYFLLYWYTSTNTDLEARESIVPQRRR
jgi:hypothetical protein